MPRIAESSHTPSRLAGGSRFASEARHLGSEFIHFTGELFNLPILLLAELIERLDGRQSDACSAEAEGGAKVLSRRASSIFRSFSWLS